MTAKDKYIQWVTDRPEAVPTFYQPYWLDIMTPKWDVVLAFNKGKEIIGCWPYATYRKLGLPLCFNPLFTPHLGPHIIYPTNKQKTETKLLFEKKTLSTLADQLPNASYIKIKANPSLQNWLPLYWKGFKQTLHYTYQLEIKKEENLIKEYTTDIRKALVSIPQWVYFTTDYKIEDVVQLMEKSFEKQSFQLPLDTKKLVALDNVLRKRSLTHCEMAYRKDGTPIGCVYTFFSNDIAYMPIIGRGDLSPEEKGIIKVLMHRCILAAGKRVKTFDFEGSMIAQFEKVFRTFGSHQVGYHVLSRIKNPLIAYYYR